MPPLSAIFMIGHLYTIVNLINGKEYIGKTYSSLDQRFHEHKSKARNNSMLPIHKAIRKYGEKNFKIYLLDSYPQGQLEQEEINAIKLFDTYNSGYNATLGGEGTRYIDDKFLVETYLKCKTLAKTSRVTGSDIKTIKRALSEANIKTYTHKEVVSLILPAMHKIKIVELDKTFDNIIECTNYLLDSGISSTSFTRTKEGIYRVCKGQRKSYLSYTFVYI